MNYNSSRTGADDFFGFTEDVNSIFMDEANEAPVRSGITSYRLRVSVSTHIGKVRGNHEDNFYLKGIYLHEHFRNDFSATYTIDNPDGMCFAVFDGMGGAAYGEIASEIAMQTLRKYEKQLAEAENMRTVDQIVSAYTKEANNAVCEMLREKQSLSGGTTFAMLYLIGGLAKLYYLGDSRIYLEQESGISCLTRDHTLANQKLDARIYTKEEAESSPDQHRLTLFIGSDKSEIGLNADSRPPVPILPGSKFMLCTDGLSNMCSDDEMHTLLAQNYFNEAAILVQEALNHGGADNVTCIVLEVISDEDHV
ncbi:MAG: serine/threonine-protein phosphatase [Ruminococcus sp.]|nr:serine/threonine-protein phosphatase [Ruminococcus sp.]